MPATPGPLEAQHVALPLAAQVELARQVRDQLLGGAARGHPSQVVPAADVDVGHGAPQCPGPMRWSGSHVAISGKMHRITMARNMHRT